MMIELLTQYNKQFIQNRSQGDENSPYIFEFTDKNSKLILSAPHATSSFCNKRLKPADLFTGALVKYIGEKNNISTIIRTKYTPYKTMIIDYVAEKNLENHYFLDIHGFNKEINADICLGVGEYKEENYPYLKEIIKAAEKYNLKTTVNHPNYTGTIGFTGRYHKKFHKPNIIQIELKKELRDFINNPEQVCKITLPFLSDIIRLYR